MQYLSLSAEAMEVDGNEVQDPSQSRQSQKRASPSPDRDEIEKKLKAREEIEKAKLEDDMNIRDVNAVKLEEKIEHECKQRKYMEEVPKAANCISSA